MKHARAANHGEVTRAEGNQWLRTVADRTGWWVVVSPLGWGNSRLEWRYGPLGGAREARIALERLRHDLATAPAGDAQAVLDRWTMERTWEQ